MPHNLIRLNCFLLALILYPACAGAQPDDHTPLAVSNTLGFAEIVDSTLKNAPEARGDDVRMAQATAYIGAGRSWLAGRPSLVGNYFDDSPLDNTGMREIEYGVQLPLWRPGEKADTQTLGDDYRRSVEKWRDSLRLTIAGRVRTMLADITLSRALYDVEQQATADAARIVAITKRQFETGALSKLDVMQSENLLLQQQQRELEAEAAMLDAEIVYRTQTGLATRPAAAHTEAQRQEEEITPQHPLLQFLQSSIDLAEGNVRQSEITAKGNPQVQVGTRRQRGDRFQPWVDSINLSINVPFGGSDVVNSRTSAARLQKVDAEVAWHTAQRQLQMALHEAEHELSITRRALPLARSQAALDAERRTLAQRAFDAGELTLTQVLNVVQEARQSARALTELQLKEQRLIAEYNQVLGEMP